MIIFYSFRIMAQMYIKKIKSVFNMRYFQKKKNKKTKKQKERKLVKQIRLNKTKLL